MKAQEIKEIAKKWGIKIANVKKADVIREIQQAEGNSSCYNTGTISYRGQNFIENGLSLVIPAPQTPRLGSPIRRVGELAGAGLVFRL